MNTIVMVGLAAMITPVLSDHEPGPLGRLLFAIGFITTLCGLVVGME